MSNWEKETWEHIHNVEKFLNEVIIELKTRALTHDRSKIESEIEASTFEIYTPLLKDCTYGSEQYKQFLESMKPALDHHYKNNRHHPEHFKNGVDGMTLIDLVEMLCDWKAATLRHKDGNISKTLDINKKRFSMSDQLYNIFKNTINI